MTVGLDPGIAQGFWDGFATSLIKGVGVMVITHDLRMVRNIADRVLVIHRPDRRTTSRPIVQRSTSRHPILVHATAKVAGGCVEIVSVEQVSHRYRTGLWGQRSPIALRSIVCISVGRKCRLIGESGSAKPLAKCIAG